MKRGQTGIGLVLLGIVAIIAVIGLVLLFTKASTEAAVVNYGSGDLASSGIGQSYGWAYYTDGRGIEPTRPTPPYTEGGPIVQYPAPPSASYTYGTRTPAYIVGGGYASIEDVPNCYKDLEAGVRVGVAHDAFNCYTVPVKGSTEADGNNPPASSAYSRGLYGKTGGNVNCYANSPYDEDLIRDHILTVLVDNKFPGRNQWYATEVNGKRVPVCYVSAKADFVFPQ